MKQALEAIENLFGARMVRGEAIDDSFLHEWRGRWEGQALCMVEPQGVREIAELVKIARAEGLHLVTQSGNTGLTGAQIPFDKERAVLVQMRRMNTISAVDSHSQSLIAGAGAVLADIHKAAASANMQFPLSIASEGSACIGGLVANNAGGHHVMRFGMMRDLVLGLEVITGTGEVWDGLSSLRKDNSGYDLKQFFIGSEGGLGIITAAALKLFPAPAQKTIFMAALPSIDAALGLLRQTQEAFGAELVAFEFMPRAGLDLVLRHTPTTRDPFSQPHPVYVLAELASPHAEAALQKQAETLLSKATIDDAVIATSQAQANALWALRSNLSAAQKQEGASIKNDIAVPVAAVPAFLAEAERKVLARLPDARPMPFGHLGDGSIHFNISAPPDMAAEDFLSLYPELTDLVEKATIAHGGTISAEHGIGLARRNALARHKSPIALNLMRQIKRAFDPDNIFNPGKTLPD